MNQLELPVSQIKRFAVLVYCIHIRIDKQFKQADPLFALCAFQLSRLLLPPHLRFHPGEQLPRTERLRDIIISSKLQSQHLIDFAILGGQHNDRRLQPSAYLSAYVHAILAGQHQIKQNEIRLLVECQLHGLNSIKSKDNLVPFFFQIKLQNIGNRTLIVHN
ncbi:hypothetical protein D3C77_554310 [compost metagenome]